ncbi:transposable element Tcb2 transposase [Trichonephila clavipes]|nr:transposable element Tcb2 transposase [Trichonephila clavipes]
MKSGISDIDLFIRKGKIDIKSLPVGNLPTDVASDELKALPSDIKDVYMPLNFKTVPYRYVFIRFPSEEKPDANYKTLQGLKFKDQVLKIDLVVTRSRIRADVAVAIVPQTISRHLSEANLKSKRPFRALPLTPEHWQLRLQWCQFKSMWNVEDWQKVVFSD